jgi:hypothetical protein
LENNIDNIDYDTYRKKGYSIGSHNKWVKSRVKNYRPVMDLIIEHFCFSHVKRLAALSL